MSLVCRTQKKTGDVRYGQTSDERDGIKLCAM